MINECGHSLCTSCVQLLFIRGQAPCPECGLNLKKTAFREQMFDDPMIDREVHIRKGVIRIYNKRVEDFRNPSDYDNYLEEVEELILGLMGNEQWAKDQRDKYGKDNMPEIRKNEALRAKEEETVVEQIEMEKRDIERAKIKLAKIEAEAELKRKEDKKKLLAKIEAGEDLSTIMVERENLNNREEKEVEAEVTLGPISTDDTEMLYAYTSIEIETFGPPVPTDTEMMNLGYLSAIRQPADQQIASGYTAQLGLSRALTDCFSCLSWKPELKAEDFDNALMT